MSGGINLTGAMRSNLLSLNNTQSLIGMTQNRLATGLKVASPLDNAQSFFTAQSLNNRASDLGRLQDRMGLATKTIESASNGIKAMTKIAENMAAIADQAREATTAAQRTTLAASFEGLREQLARTARDSGFNGTNLLNGQALVVDFNQGPNSQLTVAATTYGAAIAAADNTFTTATAVVGVATAGAADWGNADLTAGLGSINTSLTQVNAAIATMRTDAQVLGSNLNTIRVREDFTKDMMNTLKSGADNLVLANENEEAANLLALQTRQQLGIQALSLASQSQQGILRLF